MKKPSVLEIHSDIREEKEYIKRLNITYLSKLGNPLQWIATTRKNTEDFKKNVLNKKLISDAVIMFATNKEKTKVVLLKEYRPIANDMVYAFPAGLIDENENIKETAAREFFEETGLTYEVSHVSKGGYSSIGLTDEALSITYGYYSGIPTIENQSESEYAEILILDRKEVKELLESDAKFSIRTRLILEHFFELNCFFE